MGATLTAGILLAAQRGKQRIEAQHVVVDNIFISQAQPHDPLADQFLHAVLDEPLIAVIHKAAGKLAQKIRRYGHFPQEQSAGIGADHPAVKIGHYFPRSQVLKTEQVRTTVCLHRLAFLSWRKSFLTKQLYRRERPFQLPV